MICKNCGSQLPDNSVFCGNCGAQQEQQPVGFGGNIPTPNVPADNNGFNPVPNSPVDNNGFNLGGIPQISVSDEKKGFLQNKKNIVIIAVPVLALILVAAIVFGVIGIAGANPDKTIDRFMTAFIDCDGEAMNKEVSASYKKAVVYALETVDLINDGKISKEADKSFDDVVDEMFEESLEDRSNDFFYYFRSHLGNNYKVEYEITAEEKADKEELKKFNEVLSRISGKDFNMKGLMLADINVSGKSGSNKYEEDFTLFLCKDGSGWRVLSTCAYGYKFSDLYGDLSLDDIEDYFY